jgi:hypothetical protein
VIQLCCGEASPRQFPRQKTMLRPKRSNPPSCESWRVVIMRSKGEHIGTVEAPDRERAEAVAIKQFD